MGLFFTAVIFFLLLGIGGGGYFAYAYYGDHNEVLGGFALRLLKYKKVEARIVSDITNNKDIDTAEKSTLLAAHEKLVPTFETANKDQKKQIKKSLGFLFKKVLQEPEYLKKGPASDQLKELSHLIVPEPKPEVLPDPKPEALLTPPVEVIVPPTSVANEIKTDPKTATNKKIKKRLRRK